jgi:hypothetical protein
VVEVDYWPISYGKSRLDRVRIDKIHGKMDIERTIMDNIEMRQLI